MEEENLKSNPLYKDVQDYLSKSHDPIRYPDKSKKLKIILSVIVPILLGFIVFVVIAFNPLKMPIANFFRPAIPEVFSNPSTTIVLNFKGQVLQVKPHPQGQQLITDIKDAPDFVLTKETVYRFVEEASRAKTPATADDLKVGDHVNIAVLYRPDGKMSWSVISVNIFR